MSNGTVPARDGLDDKANRLFAGKVVRKDLVRKVRPPDLRDFDVAPNAASLPGRRASRQAVGWCRDK